MQIIPGAKMIPSEKSVLFTSVQKLSAANCIFNISTDGQCKQKNSAYKYVYTLFFYIASNDVQ